MKKYKVTDSFYFIVAIALGAFLTIIAIVQAYNSRGYFAIGGEWFIVPLMIILVELVLSIKRLKKGREK